MFKTLTAMILTFGTLSLAQANDDYREFTACVDELLDKNDRMDPRVAEDICADILDKKQEDLQSTNLCDMILNKRR